MLEGPRLPLHIERHISVSRRIKAFCSLGTCKSGNDTQHEFIDLAELFRPSSDGHVKTLIELAEYHLSKKYCTEVTIIQFTAAAESSQT
jgi:hypothetical protein